MSVHIIGAEEGTVDTGLYGATASFPSTSFLNGPMRRLGETRMAMLRGQSLDYVPSWNDLLMSHRETYDRNFRGTRAQQILLSPRRFAFKSDALFGKVEQKLQDQGFAGGSGSLYDQRDPSAIQTASGGPATGIATSGGVIPSTAGQWSYSLGAADRMGAVALLPNDPGLALQAYIAINVTAATDMIRIFRQSATNWRIERVVASTPATELDIATTAAIDPPGSSAMAIRRDGTRCRAFANGRKIADFTLNAAAQALTGTNASVQGLANTRYLVDNVEFYAALPAAA